MTDDDLLELKNRIDNSVSVDELHDIMDDASTINTQRKLEQEALNELRKRKNDAIIELKKLHRLTDDERLNFESKINDAADTNMIDALLIEAQELHESRNLTEEQEHTIEEILPKEPKNKENIVNRGKKLEQHKRDIKTQIDLEINLNHAEKDAIRTLVEQAETLEQLQNIVHNHLPSTGYAKNSSGILVGLSLMFGLAFKSRRKDY